MKMNRRKFFKAGAGVSAAATVTSPCSAADARAARGSPAIIASCTAGEHRRRLENIALAGRSIRTCLRRHLITGYLPGQCCYNLGEYPGREIWSPDERDERELDRLRDHGIRLIQVHEEWGDSQRLLGSHKLAAANPAGFRRFVEMVHQRGMKIIVYVSSGYFQRSDPDFREEWSAGQDLVEVYFDYAHCSAASPGWRAYFLPRLARILDDYGVDGIYNDLGYLQPTGGPNTVSKDGVPAFEESATRDGALGDFLALIYAEVHRRGGIVKVHRGNIRRPLTEMKVYDYLWVGEGGRNGDALREDTKDHPPYVVPCLDMSRAAIENEDELYLHAIPYLQFPLLLAGRPFTGERALIPGIKYPRGEACFWTRHCRAIWKHHQEHPNGPHSYGWWDSCPGRPEARPTHARWLKQYAPLVEEGAWAWLEISDSDLFAQAPPKEVVASVFANRDFHLVLANYGRAPVEVATTAPYLPVAEPTAAAGKVWRLAPRSMRILRRAA